MCNRRDVRRFARVPNSATSLDNASKEVKNDFGNTSRQDSAEFKSQTALVNKMSETIMENEKKIMKSRLDMSNFQGRFNLADKQIDRLVYELYNAAEDENNIIEGGA